MLIRKCVLDLVQTCQQGHERTQGGVLNPNINEVQEARHNQENHHLYMDGHKAAIHFSPLQGRGTSRRVWVRELDRPPCGTLDGSPTGSTETQRQDVADGTSPESILFGTH